MRPVYSMEVYNHLLGEPPAPRGPWWRVGVVILGVSLVLLIVLIHQLFY